MRSRIVDLLLFVGLVVVSGGILWTLFTLGGTPRASGAPRSTPPAATSGATSGATAPGDAGASAGARGVVAIDPNAAPPGGAPATNGAGAAATPAAGAGATTPSAPAIGSSSLAAPTAAPAAAPTPEPLTVAADGTIALERIGYSYVTGGAGACGVVLEAWRHVAVSRDLLAAYGCGAEVRITLDDPAGDRTEVVGVIGDTMNPSFSRTVNVYVGEDEDAFAYGLTTGTFAVR